MKKIVINGVMMCSLFITSCVNEDVSIENPRTSKSSDCVIEINTTRSAGNILGNRTGVATRAIGDDPFTEIREVECFESVVLPELQPHIWMGNIMTKGSIINCVYKPLIYPRNPITLSLTLLGTSSQNIQLPSYSKYLAYIQDQIGKGTFVQNNEFSFSVDQFTSYNELKVAFGSNVNTNGLFWHSSTSSSQEDHTIAKATGLYVKFYQTSFKAIMDYPTGQIAEIPDNLVDSAVYINSITYGRLGILTLETNEIVDVAKEKINKIFKTIISSSSTTFSKEEQSFLDGCEFKVYLIGGNGSTSVQSFSGLNGFIQHIKKGTFSRNEPGTPIFCTFNHVKDNSPVSVNFRFNVKKEPLYVEMVYENKDLFLYFYKTQSKIPTIAHPSIDFQIKDEYTKWTWEYKAPTDRDIDEHRIDTLHIQNSGYQTSLKFLTNVTLRTFVPPISHSAPRGDHDRTPGRKTNRTFLLLDSPNNEYVIIGSNTIGE